MSEATDQQLMSRALDLARAAGRGTAPNPRVGAVVARDGEVLGEGWHRRAGLPHAEPQALAAAGVAARGATLYTTLEPCAHHGRTPACTDAILAAGIARVVVGLADPDPRVQGRGEERLRAAGVRVERIEGAAADAARALNADYIVHRVEGRAYAALKLATTLDGRIGDRDGCSRWITGEAARACGRALRNRFGAIVVGAGTVRADDPELLPPGGEPGEPPFVRAIVAGRLQVPTSARLFASADCSPVVVYGADDADAAAAAALRQAGADVVLLPRVAGGRIALRAVLEDLGRRGVLGAVVEGGGQVHAAALEAGLADEVHWFLAPRVLGDREAVAAVDGGPRGLADAWGLTVAQVEVLGDDIHLVLHPRAQGA